MRTILSLTLSFSFGLAGLQAQKPDSLAPEEVPLALGEIILENDPFVAKLDSLLYQRFFVSPTDSQELAATELFKEDSLVAQPSQWPDLHDTIYEERLRRLNAQSPMELVYNATVRSYIDLYLQRRPEQVSRMLGLAEYYFPLFEEMLDRYNMPLELKYLAVVESALNPLARSRVGATGIWQFMYSTGRLMDLKVSSYHDERSDPLKSTEAACQYLTQLYGIFGDWNLALAAYNSGPGNVNKAIRRSGGQRNYWAIRAFLPRETAGYVPAFIAVNYVMNHAQDHRISPVELKASFWSTDTVWIKEQVSFAQISTLVGISEEDLRFLNPQYRQALIPKQEDDYFPLRLPSDKLGLFISNEDSIYALAAQDFSKNKAPMPTYVEMEQRIRHRVQRGEVLGTIAEKYGVGVSSLRRWNGLRGNTIRVGQYLTVYPRKIPSSSSTSSSSTAATKSPSSSGSAPSSGSATTYTVRSGESFYSIARQFPGVSADNIMTWNKISNPRQLKPGMVLKIYPQS